MNASEKIDQQIASYDDWRGERLAHLRKLINDADPNLKEEWKWSTAVWSYNGKNLLAVGAFKDHVKINFFFGAALDVPEGTFNSGLDSKDHRSINFSEDDKINEKALKDLIRSATNN
jgi:hypothetical protein